MTTILYNALAKHESYSLKNPDFSPIVYTGVVRIVRNGRPTIFRKVHTGRFIKERAVEDAKMEALKIQRDMVGKLSKIGGHVSIAIDKDAELYWR